MTSHLYRPKIAREQSDDQDKTRCKVLTDPVTEQVAENGNHPKKQVEEGSKGVSEIQCTATELELIKSLKCQ